MLDHSIASVREVYFDRIGMHSWRLITIYLQSTNAAFHKVV